MIDHYFKEIRRLLFELERAGQWQIEKAPLLMSDLIECLVDASAFIKTAPASPKLSALEHEMRKAAEDVVKNSNYMAHKMGYLETVFSIVPNPTYLHGPIQRLINNKGDEECLSLAREAIRLGAVYLPEHATAGSSLTEDRDIPVDLCKGLLENYINGSWAYDLDKFNQHSVRGFHSALLVMCADNGESEYVVDHLERARSTILQDALIFAGEDTVHTSYKLIVQDLMSEEALVTLWNLNPKLYKEVTDICESQILSKITDPHPARHFDASRLPPTNSMDDAFLAHAMDRLSGKGLLTAERYDSLRKCWENANLPGSLADFCKLSPMRDQCSSAREHRKNVFAKQTLSSLFQLGNLNRLPHQSLLILDDIYSKSVKIRDDATALDNHHAMHIFKQAEIPESAKLDGNVQLTELMLKACLKLIVDSQAYGHKQSKEIVDVVTEAFRNPAHYDAIKDISLQSLKRIRQACKRITDEDVRKIQWQDMQITGELFTEDLGL